MRSRSVVEQRDEVHSIQVCDHRACPEQRKAQAGEEASRGTERSPGCSPHGCRLQRTQTKSAAVALMAGSAAGP